MTSFPKVAAAATAALSLAALAPPARAGFAQFATSTPASPSPWQWSQDGDGVGGTLATAGGLWLLKEVLPAEILDGLQPLSGLDTLFSLSASTDAEYGCPAGTCGIGGFGGSLSHVYVGPSQSYTQNGQTRTLEFGASLLTVSFENAFLESAGAGAFLISTVRADPATILSVSSDLFDIGTSDVGLAFVFSGGGLTLSPNGKNFDNFETIAEGRFSAGAIPEPATWALLIMGFGVGGTMLRRARRLQAPT